MMRSFDHNNKSYSILAIVGVLAVFCTTFMAMGLSELFDLVANHSLAISSYFVAISVYMTAGMCILK